MIEGEDRALLTLFYWRFVPCIQGDWCFLLSWCLVVGIVFSNGLVPTNHLTGIGVSCRLLSMKIVRSF